MKRILIALTPVICVGALAGAALSAADRSAATRVPLCPGLTIVTAVAQQDGDYESIKTIQSVDSKQVRLRYSVEKMQYPGLFDDTPPVLRNIIIHRTVLTADLASAKNYQQRFMEKSVEIIPETTAIGASAAVLNALKRTGAADLGLSNAGDGGWTWTADRNKTPNYYQALAVAKLKRVAKGSTSLPVLVNDSLVELPAIHAEGDWYGDKVEFFFLDDDRNPLTLAFRIGVGAVRPLSPEARAMCKEHPNEARTGYRCDLPNGGDRETLRVIKIAYRCTTPGAAPGGNAGPGGGQAPGAVASAASGLGSVADAASFEHALAEKGSVDIYSIHFSFNSATIRDESEPTLKEIADVLRRHPDWKLGITGHTDGIGTPQYNVDLSTRRAAAVRTALVTRYAINGNRLGTSGLGESQPKDTNDTLEGRARNRRVELTRQQ
ncbi:MAG: OmpA family protein [Vicinamibacteraceae bacterium]